MPGVEAILCDRSALDFWRGESVGEGRTMGYRAALPERRGVVAHDPPSAATVEELRTWGLVGATDDVHLLVTSHDARRRVKGLVLHEVAGPLPKDSLVRAKGPAFAVCPGLLFVMLAAKLPLVELLEVGYELCGSYRLGGEVPSYGLAPLASASELRTYAQRAKGVRGREAALRAAQWLADGSGSPAETALAIAFALPQRLGGCNLGGFELNRELELGEGAARILGRGFVRPDFYWSRAAMRPSSTATPTTSRPIRPTTTSAGATPTGPRVWGSASFARATCSSPGSSTRWWPRCAVPWGCGSRSSPTTTTAGTARCSVRPSVIGSMQKMHTIRPKLHQDWPPGRARVRLGRGRAPRAWNLLLQNRTLRYIRTLSGVVLGSSGVPKWVREPP